MCTSQRTSLASDGAVTDRKVFPNHSEDDSLTMHKRIAARLTWGWKNDEGGYVVRSKLSGSALRCRPNPDMVRPRFSAFALAQVLTSCVCVCETC